MSNLTVLQEYEAELDYALGMKEQGINQVSETVGGTAYVTGIDAYIDKWRDGITAMNAGADPALFAY